MWVIWAPAASMHLPAYRGNLRVSLSWVMVMIIAILEVYGITNVCSGESPLLPLDRMSTLRCSRVTCILTLTTILQSGQHSLEAPQRGGCCEAGQCLPWLKLVDWDDAWSYYCSRGRSIHRRWLRRHPHCQLTLKFSSTLLTVLAVAGVATLLVSESFQPSLDSNVPTLPFHFQKPDALLWRLPASTKAPKSPHSYPYHRHIESPEPSAEAVQAMQPVYSKPTDGWSQACPAQVPCDCSHRLAAW